MSSRETLKHTISVTEPVGASIGDEWFNPATPALLYKRVVKNNIVGWSSLPLDSPVVAAASSTPVTSNITISNKNSAYTVIAGDLGTIINCTSGAFTISLTSAATLGAGFNVTIWNSSTTSTDAITIDPAGAETIEGNATIVLRTSEGTQIISDGTNWRTGAGKEIQGFAENRPTSTRPNATGYEALAIGASANATGVSAIALGSATASQSNSFAVGSSASASQGSAMAFGVNSSASGISSIAFGPSTVAQGSYSTALGHNSAAQASQAISNSGAMALGGSYASGTDSFAAAGVSNTATYGARNTSAVAIGYQSQATGTYSLALGSRSWASSTNSIAIGGSAFGGPVAIGNNSIAFGTNHNLSNPGTNAAGSIAFGDGASTGSNAVNSVAIMGGSTTIFGQYAYGAGDSGATAQTSTFVLKRATMDATPVALLTERIVAVTSPSTTNQIVLRNNSAYAFSGTIVARQQASQGTQSAAWQVTGLIRREGSAAATVLVDWAMTTINNTPGWALALSADTTNGGLAITATGAAAINIYWVATIQTSEVTYA